MNTSNSPVDQTARHGLRSSQAGLSLVELLVALTLSLIMVAALSELYVNLSRSGQEMSKTNSQIENARFAIQFLQNDVVHSGYWGTFVPEFDDLTLITAPGDVPSAVPSPCLAYTTPWTAAYINALIGIPVQVHNTVPAGCAGIITNRLANTDILVIRHANTCVPGEANCEADIAGNLYFQASNCEAEIDAGVLYTLSTTVADFTRYERDCDGASGSPPSFTSGTIAAKRKFIQNIYYIRDYANTVGDGIPTLVRSQFNLNSAGTAVGHQAAEELVQGIEAFRIEVGIDDVSDSGAAVDYTTAVAWADSDNLTSPTNRGDSIPDGNFVYCGATCTAAQLMNVVAVKIWLLARTDEPTAGYTDTKVYRGGSNPVVSTGPFNDGFKRHIFTSTIRINNVAGRRETP
jgi:type IV pilus assembly protein PilW